MNPIAQTELFVAGATAGGRFHHVGFVVASIEGAAESLAQSIGGDWDGRIIHDPLQVVRVTFLRSPVATDPLLELIEPAGGDSPVLGFLKRGGGLHHLCYEVFDLDKQLEASQSRGDLVVRSPLPAAAFGDRRIAWVYARGKLLLEYLER